MTEYKYKYYSASQKRTNTNTSFIQLFKNDQILISFVLPKRTKYEYKILEGPCKQWREETSQYQCYILFGAYDMQFAVAARRVVVYSMNEDGKNPNQKSESEKVKVVV